MVERSFAGQPLLDGPGSNLRAGRDPELLTYVTDMGLGRAFGDDEGLGDLPVRVATGDGARRWYPRMARASPNCRSILRSSSATVRPRSLSSASSRGETAIKRTSTGALVAEL